MMAWPMPPTAGFAPRRADWRFLFEHPAHPIALGFGSGLAPKGAGTVGTLFGWAVFVLVQPWLGDWQWALLLLVSFAVGWWACTRCAQALRQSDPGAIVWDEVLGIWVVLWLVMPTDWLGQLAPSRCFACSISPSRARWPGPMACSRRVPVKPSAPSRALGILLDDLVAALCALLVIALWRLS